MENFIGYMHPHYAASFREFGEPRELPRCGGWILERSIPGTPYKDAMGCYPLFACRDWTKLHEDLGAIGSGLVSLSLVTDPFSGVVPPYLDRNFDLVKPFKTHYVINLKHPLKSFVGSSHRRKAHKSLEIMDVEVCHQPGKYLKEWIELYGSLTRTHNIEGIKAFSPKCFEIQLNLPGMVMFLGRKEGEVVGAVLILIQGQAAHYHLSACNSRGYKIRASYGILWKALEYSSELGIRCFNLGGMAGIKENPLDGLAQFKKGWSNDRRMVYFCGRIFDRQRYASINPQYSIGEADYFPSYRAGEFYSQ